MALWRPCRRFVQAFSKIHVSCQAEYIRGYKRVTRYDGYVAVAPKPCNSITNSDKLEVSSSNVNASNTSSSSTADLQRRLVSLCYGAKNGRIRNEDLQRILDNYAGEKDAVEDSTRLTLLRHCGYMLPYVKAADRRIFTDHVWQFIRQDTSTLTLEHYNTLLSIHAQNNQPVDPQKFLNDMSVKPDIATYRLLMNAVARCGDVASALDILSKMKNEGYPLNEEVFNMLILAYAINKDINAALDTLNTMKDARIEPGVDTYANIACGYASVGDIDNMMEILNAHPLNLAQIMEIVKCLSNSKQGKHIPNVLKFLSLPVNANDTIFLNMLTELLHGGHTEDAFGLLDCLPPEASTDESNPVISSFLRNIVRANIPNNTILKCMNTFITEKNYPLAIMDVCEGALRAYKHELALAVFEIMHEKKIELRPHYYWPLLIQASRSYGESDVFSTLKHMLRLNVVLDYDTLFKHVLPYINTVDPLITLRKLCDIGFETSVIFTPLICYLLNQGKVEATLSLCSKIKAPIDFDRVLGCLCTAYNISNNVNDCVKMFKYAPLDKFYPEAFLSIVFGKTPSGRNAVLLNKFIEAFRASEIPVSNFTVVKVGNVDGADGRSEVAYINPLESVRPLNTIPHPRDMNLNELECHLIELKAKGMNLRGVLRRLLQFHCRENNLTRVDAIKSEYDENEYDLSPGMTANLMQLYAQNDRVEEAMSMYARLQNYKDFTVDDFKIVNLATALVNANRISEAFTILEAATPVTGGLRISKNCWRLLDTVAHSSSRELTEKMLELLVRKGFCEKDNNTLLGPLVRVHLLRNDLASAVDTFVKYAERYRYTPLRQELVCALIKSINTDDSRKDEIMKLLEEVQNITMKIHGDVVTKMDLLVAFTRFEMTAQLRKFLEINRVPDDALKQHLTYIAEDQKLLILTTLLDTSIGLSNINRDLIYEQILELHSRSGDCQKAIELWNRMSQEDKPASQKFRRLFVSLLKMHNVPLPESFSDTRFDQ